MAMDPKLQKVLDKTLKLPAWQRLLILIVLAVLIAVGYYFTLHTGQVAELEILEAKLTERQAKLTEDKELASNLPQHRQTYERMQKVLDKSLEQLPNQSEIPSLLTSIGNNARSLGLSIVGFKPLPEIPKGFYAEVPFDMALMGNYHDVALFFDQVGKLNRIININNLDMAPVTLTDGTRHLSVKCLGTTFRFLSIEEQEAIKKAAAATRKPGGRK